MQQIFSLVRRKIVYFLFFLAVIAVVGLLAGTAKISGFILINCVHAEWTDVLFRYFTFPGDGLFCILGTAGFMLMAKFRSLSFHLIIMFLVSGIAAQVLKRIFAAPRPREIIVRDLCQSFIEGMGGAGWNSFLSGHAASFFALATIVRCNVHKRIRGIVFLMIAILVAYSGIYRGLQFPADVLAGYMLGTGTVQLLYLFVKPPKRISRVHSASATENETAVFSPGLAFN